MTIFIIYLFIYFFWGGGGYFYHSYLYIKIQEQYALEQYYYIALYRQQIVTVWLGRE